MIVTREQRINYIAYELGKRICDPQNNSIPYDLAGEDLQDLLNQIHRSDISEERLQELYDFFQPGEDFPALKTRGLSDAVEGFARFRKKMLEIPDPAKLFNVHTCSGVQAASQTIPVRIGDILEFGEYPQEADGTRKPIRWNVVEIDAKERKALLISEKILDYRQFYYEYNNGAVWSMTAGTWEDGSSKGIRGWLNREFMNAAFPSDAERSRIASTHIEVSLPVMADVIKEYKESDDHIFLPSKEEQTRFLTDANSARKPTEYAKKKGKEEYAKKHQLPPDESVLNQWWLRTLGYNRLHPMVVKVSGERNNSGVGVDTFQGIVPALWFYLDAPDKKERWMKENKSILKVCKGLSEGDILEFGSYPQTELSDRQPIRWIVLAVEKGEVLLLSEKILFRSPYSHDLKRAGWKTAQFSEKKGNVFTLRSYLNKEFLSEAFPDQEEFYRILAKKHDSCREVDKVFLLSEWEAKHYQAGQSEETAYALGQGNAMDQEAGKWWLRNAGSYLGSTVDGNGKIHKKNTFVFDYKVGVRPAIWIR